MKAKGKKLQQTSPSCDMDSKGDPVAPRYSRVRAPKDPNVKRASSGASLSNPRMVYFVPIDAYVEGQGWRPSIVVEGEDGHHPTGTWPYSGKFGETMPYFWGHDYDAACTRWRPSGCTPALRDDTCPLCGRPSPMESPFCDAHSLGEKKDYVGRLK